MPLVSRELNHSLTLRNIILPKKDNPVFPHGQFITISYFFSIFFHSLVDVLLYISGAIK